MLFFFVLKDTKSKRAKKNYAGTRVVSSRSTSSAFLPVAGNPDSLHRSLRSLTVSFLSSFSDVISPGAAGGVGGFGFRRLTCFVAACVGKNRKKKKECLPENTRGKMSVESDRYTLAPRGGGGGGGGG